ncbi:hypothetical protein M430DRAFT_260273 [Amorphotheca resinae ATCC 22711]|uniref:Uncharacterized protein n=1 Tax=Amorphotheca resinae ATCC 22711 TaxID=857342 RepID=A0A2T3AZ94_AMORE|nr:hypothetical protein M430DRAFT_260273 [Amorphotheca resinae ATCC 22711]PSS15361.1 hypothetical protein M430DRAFT_260273 [Amorphotheca resinae ATCC 22711]
MDRRSDMGSKGGGCSWFILYSLFSIFSFLFIYSSFILNFSLHLSKKGRERERDLFSYF